MASIQHLILSVKIVVLSKIPFSRVPGSSEINRASVFGAKCIGSTHSELQMFCAVMNLPPSVSINRYTVHTKKIEEVSIHEFQTIMETARQYVRKINGAKSDVVDITVSCDGTWQRCGFSSLFGAVFIIEYNTGFVMDYLVKSKYCESCRYWEQRDHKSEKYIDWKQEHDPVCKKDFDGSAGSMEPNGALIV